MSDCPRNPYDVSRKRTGFDTRRPGTAVGFAVCIIMVLVSIIDGIRQLLEKE